MHVARNLLLAISIALMCSRLPLHGTLSSSNDVDYTSSAFVTAEAFYLGVGADSPTKEAFSVTRAAVALSPQGPLLALFGIAPKNTDVNIALPQSNQSSPTVVPSNQANPLYDQVIATMTLQGIRPIVLLATDTVDPVLGPNQKVVRINNETGSSITTNLEVLNDSTGQPTAGVVKIAASMSPQPTQQNVFAAVLPNGGSSFGGVGSGIGVLYQPVGRPEFAPADAQTGATTGNMATAVNGLLTTGLVAISADSTITAINDMYWDQFFNRLYVALSVERASAASAGGALAILVGQVSPLADDVHLLTLRPAVALDSSNFTADSTTGIFGFYATGAAPLIAQAHNVRTMRTSTDAMYLIVNGSVSSSTIYNEIYALPLVEGTSNPLLQPSAADIGRVASKNNPHQLASGVANMTQSTDPAAQVGCGPLPCDPGQIVRSLVIAGDAVIAGLSGDNTTGARDATHETGYFQSSAIFNIDGSIAAWTPWQRVMGSVDRVLAGGFDGANGSFMYLTSKGKVLYPGTAPMANTVKNTRWGSGALDGLLGGTSTDVAVGLVTVLNQYFSAGIGGVQQIFDFNQYTPTFSQPGAAGNLSLMVALGLRRLALIQTGSNNGSIFSPTVGDFSSYMVESLDGTVPTASSSTLVMGIAGGVLSDMGPLCCADISRGELAGGEKGWLFVGGYGGLAVLSRDDGSGWNTAPSEGLQSGFGNLTTDMSFRKIGQFGVVYSVACDESFVYVLTSNELARIPLDAANFSQVGAVAPSITILATAAGVTGATASGFRDMFLSGSLMMLATTNGLFRGGNGSNVQLASNETDMAWTPVLANSYSIGPVIQLFAMPRSSTSDGVVQNLYAVSANLNTALTTVYRFAVQDTQTYSAIITDQTVQLIPQITVPQFLSFGTIRQNFVTDGALILHELPFNFGTQELLKVFPMSVFVGGIANRGRSIALDFPNNPGTLIGRVVRDSASGAWIVPGEWGIRVQE